MSATSSSTPSPPLPPQGLKALTELAMDLRWTWNHSCDELWRRLDPALWGASGGCVYQADVPKTRPVSDYTVRAIPQHLGAAVPLESSRILWQR